MKKKESFPVIIPDEVLVRKIYFLRGQKVMLDSDLSDLYGLETRTFNQAVNRNLLRFPPDFMFRLTRLEFDNLISQTVISSWGGRRKLPLVFTENGVAMLSGILKSETAIRVNIQIIRLFTKMREFLQTHKEILHKLEKTDQKIEEHDKDIEIIFKYLKRLLDPPQEPRKKVGFRRKGEE